MTNGLDSPQRVSPVEYLTVMSLSINYLKYALIIIDVLSIAHNRFTEILEHTFFLIPHLTRTIFDNEFIKYRIGYVRHYDNFYIDFIKNFSNPNSTMGSVIVLITCIFVSVILKTDLNCHTGV